MDEDQWMYDSIMSEEVDMNDQNEDEVGVNEEHDCSNAFNISQVFAICDDVLHWARSIVYEIGFVVMIMRSNTNNGIRGRTSFVLIGCERSGQYRAKKKDLVKTCTSNRKCEYPFKLHAKPVVGDEGWMVKLICGSHNHELVKSVVGYSYASRLTKDEKIIVANMTKSMVKPKNILLTLKEHNVYSCTTIKQIYNDENVVRDIFWSHPDAVKLTNACNLVFLIDNTYKTNRYKLPLLDIVGVTPTEMTFSTAFAYLEGECLNNVVWALQRFQGLFLRCDALPGVIVTNRDLTLMNAVKTIFPEATNLLCQFHIDKNVKTK
ncbi:Protein FAR1-RELATED SEQUENCE 5 [Glycine max]|nr:Protein FAR1-RELATED SEQUENCE 5 [Glycine max]